MTARTDPQNTAGVPPIRLLFSRAEAIALKRCPDCGWHLATQGHHPHCPTHQPDGTDAA